MNCARSLATSLGAAAALIMGLATAAYASEGGYTHEQYMDLAARFMNFAVLAGTLFYVLRKPLSSALKNRTEGIAEELKDLEARKEEAQREYALMEQKLKDAQGERDRILEDFRQQGENEKAKIVENAKVLAERIRGQAQLTIEHETAKAKAELCSDIAEMSASVAEDLLKQKITAEDQTRLVDEYLAKVRQEVQ